MLQLWSLSFLAAVTLACRTITRCRTQLLKVSSICLLSTLLWWPPNNGRVAAKASSLATTSTNLFEKSSGVPAAFLMVNEAAQGGSENDASSAWREYPDLLNVVCLNSAVAPDIPQSPSREDNIEELQIMLRDPGLEHAAEKLWSAYYGHNGESGAPQLEDWTERLMELLREMDTPGEDGKPSGAHKSQLFFLLNMLKEDTGQVAAEGGRGNLQEELLAKLRKVAGEALGGSALIPMNEQDQGNLRTVRKHSMLAEHELASPVRSLLPRSLVAVAGARNPFLLGLFWNLLIAYGGFEAYFGETPTLPFYSWLTLLTSLSGHSNYHLDAMCAVKKHRSPLKRLASRARGRSTPASRKDRRQSSLKASSHRTLCELSDRLMLALTEFLAAQVSKLMEAGAALEPGLPPLQNMKRLHTQMCLPRENGTVQMPCVFEESLLAQESRKLNKSEDDLDQQIRHTAGAELLKQAHTTITGLGALDCKMGIHRAATFEGVNWGLQQPPPVDAKLEQGKARVLERLNIALATMLTTSSLDAASSFWLTFERRTLKQAVKAFEQNILRALRPVGMEFMGKKLLRSSANELPLEDLQTVVNLLNDLGGTPDGLRAALAFYSILPSLISRERVQPTVLVSIKAIFKENRIPLMLAIRDKPIEQGDAEMAIPLQAPTHLWVFAFLSELEGYPSQKEMVLRNQTWVKLLYSHGPIPKFVRNIFYKFTAGMLGRVREKRIQKARKVLRKALPSNFFESLFDPFRFTVHSGALMQIVNFHSMKHDEAVSSRDAGIEKPRLLRESSVAKRMDNQLKLWASHGMDPTLLESHADFAAFKRAWEKVDLKGLPLPDLTDWWARLNAFVAEGLEAYLSLERHLEPLQDTVYALVSDSLRNLKNDEGQTLFFTRFAHKQRVGPLRRLWNRAKKSLLGLLYRAPSRKHGVWFGVTVDFDKLHMLLEQFKRVIEAEPRLSVKVNFEEALLQEVETELRVRGADASRVPPLVERNIGMLGVRRHYGSMSTEGRKLEFQASMCSDHCRSLWQMALSAMLPPLLRPEMMQRYEKAFGTSWALRHLSDPALVNSRRMIMKSDAALNFFDHSTPKEIREELKGLESGQGTMFAYYMLFSSRVHYRLGNQYLGLNLRQQAPFMGNMVLEWISTRRRHAVGAIISSLVLTFLGIYAVMSFLDILQNLTISGASPPFNCIWNPLFQEMACSPVPGGATLNTAWVTALEQVFLIGLFSGTGGSISLLLAVKSAITIAVNQSKTLMRLQMCLGSAVMRLFRRGARSFSSIRDYFERRRAVRRAMLSRAVAGMKNASKAVLVDSAEALQQADGMLERISRSPRFSPVKQNTPSVSSV